MTPPPRESRTVQAMRNYETQVRLAMFTLGSGTFRLEIDEAAPGHMNSHNAIVNVILSELNHGRRYIGASTSTDAFVARHERAPLAPWADGWEDTGFTMVGVPAVLRGIWQVTLETSTSSSAIPAIL